MFEMYEYRHAAPRPAIWLSAAVIVFLLAIWSFGGQTQLFYPVLGMIGALLAWMTLGHNAFGLRVDDTELVLSAWSRPRPIPLSEIAHLRVNADLLDECPVTVVYKDGREEGTFAGDIPPLDVLAEVMAERGIPMYGALSPV